MDYIKKRTHIINHERFLAAGPVARDLYDWGMLWSGQQETDGEIPLVAVQASPWGAGGKKNAAVAQKLVDVGLWERSETGFRVRKWVEQGNVTKAEIDAKRQVDRVRKARQRRASEPPSPLESATCPSGTPSGTSDGTSGGTPADFPTSYSSSNSGSDLRDLDPPDRLPTPLESDIARRFEPGTAGFVEAKATFEAAVSSATGGVFAMPRAPFHAADLCDVLNKHSPPGPASKRLAWLGQTVSAWVAALGGRSSSGWQPSRLLDWLNGGRAAKGIVRAVRPQDIMQPEIPGSWSVPEDMP